MAWIMTDDGHLLNLDHFTRLDWGKPKGRGKFSVSAVKDFRYLGMVRGEDGLEPALQTYRICDVDTEEEAKKVIAEIAIELNTAWTAPRKES